MILVDVNIPVHAINSASPHHEKLRTWWDDKLSGSSSVGLAWVVCFGFVRIITNPRIVMLPQKVGDALNYVTSWLDQPCTTIVQSKDGRWKLVASLLREAGTAANLTTDAHLAALAIQNGCELCTTDNDFARFPGLRWHNLLTQ